jgi:hypothetical protein
MELRAEGLAFSIMFTPPDDEGWMWCNAIVNVPGFRGDVDFHMLRSDLECFHAGLSAAMVASNWPCEVHLESTDPGVDLSLHVERTGQINGDYQFGGRGAYRPVISGSFAMDQTYLGPLLAQVEQLLIDLD